MLKNPFFAVLALCCALTTSAQARINGPHPRECVMSVGPTQIMFSAFQENKTNETFCAHVPELGPTIIILDARHVELRDMNIEVRVLRNIGQKDWRDDLEANTVAVLPAGKHLAGKGTANFSYNFDKDGDYIALVKATSDDGAAEYVGQYFFSVGESLAWFLACGAVALTFGFIAFGLWQRGANKPAQSARIAPSPARRST
jgi:hypothetical protein